MPKLHEAFPLKKMRPDGGTQTRTGLNQEKIDEYASAYRAGEKLPPVELFFDKKNRSYWITDGFHRYYAAKTARLSALPALEVGEGSQEDAEFHACAANKNHGLNRSNDDKKKAVTKALKLRPMLSDREIARHCGVSPSTVAKHREDLGLAHVVEREGADGRTYDTSNLRSSTVQLGQSTEPTIDPEPEAPSSADEAAEFFGSDEHLADEEAALNVGDDEPLPFEITAAGREALRPDMDIIDEGRAADALTAEERPAPPATKKKPDPNRPDQAEKGRAADAQGGPASPGESRGTGASTSTPRRRLSDINGNPLPEAMHPAAEALERLAAVASHLRAAKRAWADAFPALGAVEASDARRFLPRDEIMALNAFFSQKGSASIDVWTRKLEEARIIAGAVCPKCEGAGCKACGLKGWWSRAELAEARHHAKKLEESGLGHLQDDAE